MSTEVSAAATRPAGLLGNLPTDRMFVVVSRLIALVALIAVLSYLSPHFFTWPNFSNILRQASLQFMISAGLTIVILTAGIDLSVGAVLGLAACLAAALMSEGHLVLGIALALLAGTACGLANGLLVTLARIPPFIATYGMLWIAFGLGYVFMKGEVIYGLPAGFRFIGSGFVWGIPVPVIIAAIMLVCLHVLLHSTVLGRAIYAIGGNPAAARLSGMPVTKYLIIVYTLSGFLAGFAALVTIARINSADSGIGEELLLPALAAVCLGGTSLFGGVGGVAGTAVGTIIMALIINGMNLLGVQSFWQATVTGAIILCAVIADQLGGKRHSRHAM